MKPVDLSYWVIGKGLLGSITHALVPLKTYGKERVPREGGCILAMNHFSYVDPPAFGTVCPRRVVFVAQIPRAPNGKADYPRWKRQAVALRVVEVDDHACAGVPQPGRDALAELQPLPADHDGGATGEVRRFSLGKHSARFVCLPLHSRHFRR